MSFDAAKVSHQTYPIYMKNRMYRILFSPLRFLFSILFNCLFLSPYSMR